MRVRSVLFVTTVGAFLWVGGFAAQRAATGTAAQAARTWTQPRTPWGDPDLQGIYTNKDENNTPFERPPELAGKRLSDFKLLFPTDLTDYVASHPVFVKEWNAIMGL